MPRTKKILVVTGTRAEYGLLKLVMNEIISSKKLELRLLVTGMHTLKRYGYTIDEIKKDKIPVDCIVKVGEKDDMLSALSKEIVGIKKYCVKSMPDMVLVLGDRDEALAVAIVASHLGVPIAHLHGGDISGESNVDAINRNAITQLSQFHFSASKKSYDRVVRMIDSRENVFNVGALGLDNLSKIKCRNKKGSKIQILIVQHPAPLSSIPVLDQIKATFVAVKNFDFDAGKIIIYPNSDTGSNFIIGEMEKLRNKSGYKIFKNLEKENYFSLLKHCDLMLGNSSSGIIEAGYFKIPVVDVGERQAGRECGANVLRADYDSNDILEKIKIALSSEFKNRIKKMKHPYGVGGTAKRIVEILERRLK